MKLIMLLVNEGMNKWFGKSVRYEIRFTIVSKMPDDLDSDASAAVDDGYLYVRFR